MSQNGEKKEKKHEKDTETNPRPDGKRRPFQKAWHCLVCPGGKNIWNYQGKYHHENCTKIHARHIKPNVDMPTKTFVEMEPTAKRKYVKYASCFFQHSTFTII